ncbi:MAG: tetratricopeptide repeat protein, partial [Chloroflexi bacterium]|nr:tetratricopeptide repeat protein [Chloroflexota bacterium]
MSELSLYEYCKQVENTIEQGRYAEAVAHGKHILKQYPKHVDTYRLLGKAMLEAGQDEYAIDMFRRVLSADPEDMIAWVGLSEVHSKHDELDAAIWYLERAFELAAGNKAIEEELRQLYSRRDGVELQKTPLTTGALARLYLKGDLLSRAVNDFRTLLDEHPERVDLRVALAEALWRNEQRLEAAEACQQVLDDLPCCLKANLILGSIWVNSGREEGQTYLRMAEAIDPENKMAQELFRDASPLPARQIHAVPLEYRPQAGEAQPDWMTQVEGVSVGPPLTEKEAMLVDITAALEAQIEIPSWLENISIDGELPASEPPSPSEIPTTAEQVPTWLMTGVSKELVKEQPEEMTEIEEETPEWLTGLGLEPIGEEMDEEGDRETPEWLAEFSADVAEEAPPAPGERREWETPEWLADLGVEADDQAPAPVAPTTEESPDWLSSLREQFAEEAPMPEEEPATAMPAPAEIPDWLRELAPAEKAPAWLDSDQLPSGDEALAWLEQLAEGKEEELQAQIKAEAEVRMAEIMGRPAPAKPPAPEIAPEEPAAEPPVPAEIPD